MKDDARIEGFTTRRAGDADVPVLAELINLASDGFAEAVWHTVAAPCEHPWDLARRKTADHTADAAVESWLVERDGHPVAGLIGYAVGARSEASPAPELIRPLAELEAEAPGTWYVNVLATLPDHRGRGVARSLLGLAARRARSAGLDALSIIIADGSEEARALCERAGFAEIARRPMQPGASRDWVLLVRPL